MTVRLVIRWKQERTELPPDAMNPPAAEHRSQPRVPVNYKFSVYPEDQATPQRLIQAQGINMSRSGALIELPEPLAVGTVVYIKTSALGLMGTATVRHCTQHGGRFRIGLYFPGALARCS